MISYICGRKNVKGKSSAVSIVFITTLIFLSSYSSIEPNTVFSQSEDNDEEENEGDDSNNNDVETTTAPDNDYSNDNIDNKKFVILTFDDRYKSQYINAKPILDKYGFKATFYIVCNYIEGGDNNRMTWDEVQELHRQGHDIGSHTMSHYALTDIPTERMTYEVSMSKQCLLNHGIEVTSFAYPLAKGYDDQNIVNTIAKYYDIARTAGAPLMFLDCGGDVNSNNPVQITTTTSKEHCIKSSPGINENNKMHFVNKYSIMGWSHDPVRKKNSYDDSQMLQKFMEVVESQAKYNNKESEGVKALPIIILHDIANDRKDAYTATSIELFESEMKYLHDNGFTVLTMADLLYDKNSNSLKIKEIYLQ